MSRIIKFRVWDNVDYMSTPFTLHDLLTRKCEYVDGLPVMQFTGLTDRNRIEIYEGDILKTPMGNIAKVLFGEKKYRFRKDEVQCFGWIAEKISSGGIETLDTSMIGEVIGNIYEHPHLINPQP